MNLGGKRLNFPGGTQWASVALAYCAPPFPFSPSPKSTLASVNSPSPCWGSPRLDDSLEGIAALRKAVSLTVAVYIIERIQGKINKQEKDMGDLQEKCCCPRINYIAPLFLRLIVSYHRFFSDGFTASQETKTKTIMSMMDEKIETWNVSLKSPWSVMKVRIKAIYSC